jgi:tRNA A37 threonylcarbamoyltransferase TsaD
LKELEKRGVKLDEDIVSYIAYKFQEVVVEVLAKKLVKAAVKYGAKTI